MASNFEGNRQLVDIHEPITDCNLRMVILHRIPSFNIDLLGNKLQTRFQFLNDLNPSDSSFQALAPSARVLLCCGPSPVTAETLDKYPSVECVVGSSAGLDHVDLTECRRRGIRVTNVGEAFSDDVADYAIGLMINVLRQVSTTDRYVRNGLWSLKGEFPLGVKVGGKRVGIVGLGSIGYRISRRLEGFNCNVAYYSRKKKPHVSYPHYANICELAANSDVLIVCCALTKETYHSINKDVMLALGKNGVIVNVGRGALIDEKELVKFLTGGEIRGAGLDVFEDEPNVPKELYALDNVVLSPHQAVATTESFAALQQIIIGNLEAFFANKPLLSEVNLE